MYLEKQVGSCVGLGSVLIRAARRWAMGWGHLGFDLVQLGFMF